MQGLIRLALIGDCHDAWDAAHDAAALAFLQPDAAVFVGDIGNERVDLVQQIAALDLPKAVILGNHDAWGPLYFRRGSEKVQQELEAVRAAAADVGFTARRFTAASGAAFSVVGGRPFSDGNNSIAPLVSQLYGIDSLQQSGERIARLLLEQPEGETVVLAAHNGPTGLGARRWDPCGKDFKEAKGDYGDSDLRQALDAAAAAGRRVPLVVFGHMHHSLQARHGGGLRDMAQIDPHTGTVFLNAAVVPRHGRTAAGALESHFLSVTLQGGVVTAAEHVWVAHEAGKGGWHVSRRGQLLLSGRLPGGRLRRESYHAFDGKWRAEGEEPSERTEL